MPAADWIAQRLSTISAAVLRREETEMDEDFVVQFGDGPPLGMRVVSLTQTGKLSISRMVESGLARAHDGLPLLYATPTLQPNLRERMAASRLSWIERGGALHIDAGSYYIHDMQGTKRSTRPEASHQVGDAQAGSADRPARLVGSSGVCAEALILWWLASRSASHGVPLLSQTTLADAAGVTPPLAGRVLHRLEALGALTAERETKRTSAWQVANVETILQLWVDEDRRPVRTTRAYTYARHPGELRSRLGHLSSTPFPWALGGVAVANLYAPTLTADPMPTVWLGHDCNPARAATSIGGEIVSEGANVVFCQVPKDPWRAFCTQPDLIGDVTPSSMHHRHEQWLNSFTTELRHSFSSSQTTQSLCMVSPVRALHQVMQDGTHRSDDVALALSERLGITHA